MGPDFVYRGETRITRLCMWRKPDENVARRGAVVVLVQPVHPFSSRLSSLKEHCLLHEMLDSIYIIYAIQTYT